MNYDKVNPHNIEAIYPKGFPYRTGTDFLRYNKHYEETHSYRKSLNEEIVNKSDQKKCGGFKLSGDGVIQRHHDVQPNKTLKYKQFFGQERLSLIQGGPSRSRGFCKSVMKNVDVGIQSLYDDYEDSPTRSLQNAAKSVQTTKVK